MYQSLRAQTLHYFARPHDGIPAAPVASPAAWRADALPDGWSQCLTPAQAGEFDAAVRHSEATGLPLANMRRADFPLPTLAAEVRRWSHSVHRGRGFLLLRGVPVQRWTPAQCERFFWGLGLHLGLPGAQNPEGDLLGHVRDQRTGQDVRYYRTNKELAVHCDTADIVGLLCLQPAKSGGLSRIASSVSVFNELRRRRPDLVARLFEPFWFDTKGEGGVKAYPIAPCRHAEGVLRTFWQSDYFRTVQRFTHVPRLTAAERELLELYDAIANQPGSCLDMDLQPGDVQLLSNHTQLHARTAFEDWPEPERRRHLLRLWISVPAPASLRQRWRRGREIARLAFTAARQMHRERKLGLA